MVNHLENIDALNEIQRAQLDDLKKRFEHYDEDYLKDDYYLLHWLIARKFNVDNAELMLIKHYRCRKAIGMDDESYRNFKTNNLMEHYYPHGVFCHDKGGRPIAYLPIGGIDSKGIVMHTKSSDIFKAIMFWQEQRKWNCADATKMFGKRIQQATYIIDLKGLGTQHLWKPGLDAFLEIAHLVEQHTPEIMYKLFIINAPAVFPIIYKLVKQVLDENTTRKIEIYGENYKEALLNFIDPNQLPINFGGTVEINGDPTCSQHITYGGIVPKELIEKEKENFTWPAADYIALKVKAGTYAQVSLIISEQDQILEWFIASDSTHDIFFGVFRTEIDSKETCTDKMEMITPYYRIYTYYAPEIGHIKARPGKYILHFDNSHSWVTGKTIKYSINVIDGDTEVVCM